MRQPQIQYRLLGHQHRPSRQAFRTVPRHPNLTAFFYGSKRERQQEGLGRDAQSACLQSERRLRPQKQARRVATSIYRFFSHFFRPLRLSSSSHDSNLVFHGLLSSITTRVAFVPCRRHLDLSTQTVSFEFCAARFWPDLRDPIHTTWLPSQNLLSAVWFSEGWLLRSETGSRSQLLWPPSQSVSSCCCDLKGLLTS